MNELINTNNFVVGDDGYILLLLICLYPEFWLVDLPANNWVQNIFWLYAIRNRVQKVKYLLNLQFKHFVYKDILKHILKLQLFCE